MNWTLYLILVAAIIVAFLILIPSQRWLKRILGYMVLADISASAYVVSTYAATGTVSGLTIAILGAVGISLTLRGLRWFIGDARLGVGGVESLRLAAAEILTQGARWVRAFVLAVFRGGVVTAPPKLEVEWIEHEAPLVSWLRRVRAAIRQGPRR
jgi:hypothetical protein